MKKGIVITGKHALYSTLVAYTLFVVFTLMTTTFEFGLLLPYVFFGLSYITYKLEKKGKKLLEIKISK